MFYCSNLTTFIFEVSMKTIFEIFKIFHIFQDFHKIKKIYMKTIQNQWNHSNKLIFFKNFWNLHSFLTLLTWTNRQFVKQIRRTKLWLAFIIEYEALTWACQVQISASNLKKWSFVSLLFSPQKSAPTKSCVFKS